MRSLIHVKNLIIILVAHSNVRENIENLHNQNHQSGIDNNFDDNSMQLPRNRNLITNNRISNLFSLRNNMTMNNYINEPNAISNTIVNSNRNIEEEITDENQICREFDTQLDEIYDTFNYLISTER
jgi:hypothetical protein